MNNNDMARKITENTPVGRRRVGRIRCGWMVEDFRRLKTTNWWMVDRTRETWGEYPEGWPDLGFELDMVVVMMMIVIIIIIIIMIITSEGTCYWEPGPTNRLLALRPFSRNRNGRSSSQHSGDVCSTDQVPHTLASYTGLSLLNQLLPKFLTGLGWHRSYTLAVNPSQRRSNQYHIP